ncbi:MAG: protein kinase [Bryobacteraceae bacterium]
MLPGESLAHYQILNLLGKGGMGEVYRARDSKLNRDVAIKVLPEALAADPDYRTRFEREAQSLAALNHPNIAAIYGLEGNAIIMELVEGATLPTPLPINEALPIARQIAEALEAAHDKGIIHRDLKPANIKITPEGAVKILDFGLAKSAAENSTATPPSADSPTIRATQAGLILGTAGYMSPEQASGKPVDRRADIWAYGVVLYELLCGSRLFDGETLSHTLADVLRKDIDLAQLPADTPASIRELLRRCLDRNLKNRLRDIGEARIAIDNASAPPPPQAISKPATTRLPWAIAALATFAAAALAYLLFSAKPPAAALSSFSIPVKDAPNFTFTSRAAISPDGRHAVYISGGKLWARSLASEKPNLLEGTDGAEAPMWSPDSSQLAFVSGSQLKKVSLALGGGAPVTLTRLKSDFRGGSWSHDGKSILFSTLSNGILEVSASRGEAKPIVQERGNMYFNPFYLPTSKRLIVAGYGNLATQSLRLIDPATGSRQTIHPSGAFPAWSSQGYILFQIEPQTPGLWALKVDPNTGTPQGEPVPIVNTGSDFSASSDGSVLWMDSFLSRRRQFVWRDRSGQAIPCLDTGAVSNFVNISPDGTQAAFPLLEPGKTDIHVTNLLTGVRNRLPSTAQGTLYPVWSPDGRELAVASSQDGQIDVSLQPVNGGPRRPILNGPQAEFPTSWSPNGRTLLVTITGASTGSDIYTVTRNADGSFGPPTPWLQTPHAELNGAFSPDGRFIAFASDATGRREVYVRPASGQGTQWQISVNGGSNPRWSGDGHLFFQDTTSLYAVPISISGDGFRPGTPVALFRTRIPLGPVRTWDIHPDGKRFLIAEPAETELEPPSLHVILNWPALLQKQ